MHTSTEPIIYQSKRYLSVKIRGIQRNGVDRLQLTPSKVTTKIMAVFSLFFKPIDIPYHQITKLEKGPNTMEKGLTIKYQDEEREKKVHIAFPFWGKGEEQRDEAYQHIKDRIPRRARDH